MHKVPGIASINRKHTLPLLFTVYKICSFRDSMLPSRSHEVLPYCSCFVTCWHGPASYDISTTVSSISTTVKILFSVATRLQLIVYVVQIFFRHVSRDSGNSSSGEE